MATNTLETQERLPITGEQIKEFMWWFKKFSGKWKTVKVWPGETETTFKSYEKDGKIYINAKNILMDTTWVYDPEEYNISVFHNNDKNALWRTLAEDWELDQKTLDYDLKWFHDCVPTKTEKASKKFQEKIWNIFEDK